MATGDKLVNLDRLKTVFDLVDGIIFGADSLPRPLMQYIINSSNKWASSNSTHVMFRCNVGDSIAITANASKAAYFAFLTSNAVTDGAAPSFATGETGRRTLAANSKGTYTAPSGTQFLYVHYDTTSSGTRSVFYPSSIQINGVEVNRHLSKDIGALESAVNSMKKRYLKYVSGSGLDSSTEKVEVYVPATVGYIRYDFVHTVSATKNADVWRVGYAYAVTDAFSERFALTTQGEWECALHLADRDDFSGGYLHGDEKLKQITIFVDGSPVDITGYTAMTAFDTFSAVETTEMYDPADGTTLIAEHGSEHVFSDRLVVSQSVTWKAAESLTQCYLAMFPPSKTYTNRIYSDRSFEVMTADGSVITVPKAQKVTLYSTTEGFSADFAITKYPSGIGSGGDYFRLTDNGGNAYNKCYYTVTSANGGATVAVNDVWVSEMVYRLNITG